MVADIKSFLATRYPSPTAQSPSIAYSDEESYKSDGYSSSALARPTVSFSKKDQPDTYLKLSMMFGFTHQEGTDRAAEISVIKQILKREDLLMKLHHLNDSIENIFKDVIINSNGENSANTTNRIMNDKMCNEVLLILSQIRECTLNYLEALCSWRQSAFSGSPSPLLPPIPRPFLWKGANYTLKIANDLDFIADNEILVSGLLSTIIPPDQLKSNPLMLANNLEDHETWMDPSDRAVRDAVESGATPDQLEGPHFEAKLRLRYAERVILQEIEISSNGAEGDSSTIKTEKEDSTVYSKYKPYKNIRLLPTKEGWHFWNLFTPLLWILPCSVG